MGGRTRIAIRKRRSCAMSLDQTQINLFIKDYDGKPFRSFKSLKGCIKKPYDALEDDIRKVKEKQRRAAPVKETPGVICSELVAIFLNRMGIIDNAFRRWKRYLPRHFLYGMDFRRTPRSFNGKKDLRVAKRQGIPRKYLNKLLAVTDQKYRLIDSIPGQKVEHRNAYR